MKRTTKKRLYGWVTALLMLQVVLAVAFAHEDPEFDADRQPPYSGPGFTAGDAAVPIEFPSCGVQLQSWLTLGDLDPSAVSGNDSWGYVSPSEREYAIVGLSSGTAFVEITDPGNPVVIRVIGGPESSWRDLKVYQQYAYAVSEGGNGIQVIDLSQIDSGTVSLANTVVSGGITVTHNVAIDEVSGFLYRAGGGGGRIGLRIYDLANPASPAFVSEWSVRYVHDVQVVTYTEGIYAGMQVAFAYSESGAGGGAPGLDILDVTDKNNIISLGFATYSNGRFSHQGWLSPDRHYVYLNDELDEMAFGTPTTTRVIDVSDLTSPAEVATFTNGSSSIDHNLYTRGNLIFESNYRSGLRVFDATNPIAPVEIAFFDTYPPDDNPDFNGLWNVYPFFPSGTVIGSDLEKGLFVWADPLGPGFADCNSNLVPDECDPDCNANGFPDDCDLAAGTSNDCNTNGLPDECDGDCNGNGLADECDLATGTSTDCNLNNVPDECDPDCDTNGLVDECEITAGSSGDCDGNGIPDTCPGGAITADIVVASNTLNTVRQYQGLTGAFELTLVPSGTVNGPRGLVYRPNGNLLVCSGNDDRIVEYAPDGTLIGDFVTIGLGGLDLPIDAVYGPNGNLFVAGTLSNNVIEYDGNSGALVGVFTSGAALNIPTDLTFGPDNNLYVCSNTDHKVLKFDGTTGAFITDFVAAGSGGLSFPQGLTFGADGHLYVTSSDNDAVLRYDGTTGAFSGTFVASGAGGLNNPADLLFAESGNLLVASSDTDAVLEYDGSSGAFVRTFATDAGLGAPWGIAWTGRIRCGVFGDGNGDMLVDLADLPEFLACMSGPAAGAGFVLPSPTCRGNFDSEPDGDVDNVDFGAFQMVFPVP